MFSLRRIRGLAASLFIVALFASLCALPLPFAAAGENAQTNIRERRAKSHNDKNKKRSKDYVREDVTGTPVMWRAPADIAARNLFLGPGGATMQPDLSRVTLIERQTGGHSTKFRVRDGSGREWIAKIGFEAQPETAAVRLVWAAGYETEINYLAPHVNIEGAGSFNNVRFEARHEGVKRVGNWRWTDNPFVGTRELQGLKVLMAMLNNWDIKDVNNQVLRVKDERGGHELRYVISDLGSTFGKTGNPLPFFWKFSRSRNKPKDFERAKFVVGVKKGRVQFRYNGKDRALFKDITVDQARWIGSLLARLSDRQIADAFRAANYRPEEVQGLTLAMRQRINELNALPQIVR